VLLAALAALCALGFLQASAIGSHQSRAAFPTSPVNSTIITRVSIPTLTTVTTTTTTTPTLTIVTIAPILTVPTLSISTPTLTASTTTPSVTTPSVTTPSVSTPVSTPTAALPVIQTEQSTTTTAPFIPPVKASLAVAVSGGGTVTGLGIACGTKGSKCYGTFKPGTKVTLHAGAGRGNKFAGWSGGCKGVSLVCVISLSKAGKVVATFAPNGGGEVPVSISKADFDVRWEQSQGSGKLQVKGKIAKPATVSLQLHRSGGSKVLLSTSLSLPAGPFNLSIKLLPGLLADGQPLLPGSFVVALGGRSGKLQVPTQLTTITLTSPPQGVVSKAFASSSARGGPSPTIPASKGSAFVHFVFQTQPVGKQPITVAWYRPGGKLLGVATKSNAPEVTSSISSKTPLPAGTWRVELRAGSKVVKSIPIVVK
jgi:Divergent InlB B-repeat domain